jgi:hypothetical protein
MALSTTSLSIQSNRLKLSGIVLKEKGKDIPVTAH